MFLESLTSLLAGGLSGIVGAGVQKIFDFKIKKLEIEANRDKYANEQKLRELDAAILQQEWAARTQVADIEATAKVETEDAKAFSAALTSEPKQFHENGLTHSQNWLMVILDFVRGSIRPALTLYLCALTTLIYLKCARLLHGDVILPGMAYDLVTQVINTILYITTTCILFWFGSRNSTKKK